MRGQISIKTKFGSLGDFSSRGGVALKKNIRF